MPASRKLPRIPVEFPGLWGNRRNPRCLFERFLVEQALVLEGGGISGSQREGLSGEVRSLEKILFDEIPRTDSSLDSALSGYQM
jgi:hypothetical protein